MELVDEAELWKEARQGSYRAFSTLFDLHAPALFRFAARLLGGAPDAEDCVQNVLVSVLERDRFDPSLGSPRSYLFGAVRNQARKLRRVPPEELTDNLPSTALTPDGHFAQVEMSEAVAAAIRHLPWAQRETLLLFHYEGLSLNEIGDALSLELAAVKSRLSRARESLRTQLQDYAPQESGERR